MEITNEQLLQKIGALVITIDVQAMQAEQYQLKIHKLEETISQLSKGKE